MSAPPQQQHQLTDRPRPALADRQCEPRIDPAKTVLAHPASKSSAKLPRAGTFTNSRLPRNASAGNLPRGRSFQGARPLTSAAQAAQDAYFQRKAAKAAKLYAERKRARAAEKDGREAVADKKPDAPDLINITVDHKGVMIDTAAGSTAPQPTGMGPRKNSRSKMTRSSSRQRNVRADDKENIRDDAPQRGLDADIDAYFSKKRGSVEPRRKKATFPDNPGSWDGSMPQRRNSRSFIESSKQRRQSAANLKNANNNDSINNGATPAADSIVPAPKPTDGGSEADRPLGQRTGAVSKAKLQPAPEMAPFTPSKDGSATSGEAGPKGSPTISNVSESSTEEKQNIGSPQVCRKDKTGGSSPASSEKCSSSSSSPSKAPLEGKWCEDCAGLGLHIAALLSEMEAQRAMGELGSDAGSSSSGIKKGWKTIVLGDSKSKSSSEKARLQQEVNVLRATVDFLYKKIECMEKPGEP